MLFSIIVPIYNVEQYIRRCINCLIEQTYADIEIILVDDESPDNCPAICDEYAAKDSRIKVIHKRNGGLSDARNAGLEVASGEYVIFVDSDDFIDTDTCERFAEIAKKGYDVLIGDASVEGGVCPLQHIEKGVVYSGQEYLKVALLQARAPMAAWLNVYRREFLEENSLKFKYGILHEDEQFTPRVLLSARSVAVTGICFYHYIIREGSITTKKDKSKNARDLYDTCCELEKIYNSIDDEELRDLLLNSLVSKYLNLSYQGRIYKYGKEYLHKDFIKRNARSVKNKKKARLYCLSPRMYCFVNNITKIIKG